MKTYLIEKYEKYEIQGKLVIIIDIRDFSKVHDIMIGDELILKEGTFIVYKKHEFKKSFGKQGDNVGFLIREKENE